jgi:hypothetical protein
MSIAWWHRFSARTGRDRHLRHRSGQSGLCRDRPGRRAVRRAGGKSRRTRRCAAGRVRPRRPGPGGRPDRPPGALAAPQAHLRPDQGLHLVRDPDHLVRAGIRAGRTHPNQPGPAGKRMTPSGCRPAPNPARPVLPGALARFERHRRDRDGRCPPAVRAEAGTCARSEQRRDLGGVSPFAQSRS